MPTSPTSLLAWGVRPRVVAASPAALHPPASGVQGTAGRDESGSSATIVEMPVHSILAWTPEDVGNAIVSADVGNLRSAADLSERLMADARIAGILSTRTHGLFGLPMVFNGKEAQITALKGSDDVPGSWWKMHTAAELAKLTSWGIMLGVGIAQRIKDPNRKIGEEDAPILRTWHPRWLRHQPATSVTAEQWFLTTAGGEIPIDPNSGEWILYRPYGNSRPWAEGAWRGLAEAWILKQYAKHGRAQFTEVHGNPLRVGTAPQGANQRARERWMQSLRSLGRNTSLVLPEGYTMDLLEATGGQGVTVYKQTIDLSDEDIAIRLAGQTVTTTGTTGFSKGNIHETIAHDLVQFTADTLSECLRKGSLEPWAASNYGDPDLAPFQKWNTERPADLKSRAETIKLFGDAVVSANVPLAAVGKRLNVEQLSEDFELDLEDLPENKTKAPAVALAPTDLAKIVTVNEGRASSGLGPLLTADGKEDPDGYMSIAAFDAKKVQEQKPPPPAQFAPSNDPANGNADPNGDPVPPGAPKKKAPFPPKKALPVPATDARWTPEIP